jgi:beta-N-acetylhexosaminidase
MQALSGSFAERTTATLDAGCDVVLHCNGEMDEMQEIANVVSDMSSLAIERLTKALALIENHDTLDREAALSRLDEILAGN